MTQLDFLCVSDLGRQKSWEALGKKLIIYYNLYPSKSADVQAREAAPDPENDQKCYKVFL